jgi:GT2 family glycosyltransferase
LKEFDVSENMYYGSDKNHITAVTVTYGDRWQYLQILLQRLEEEELVRDVVVVDNASRCDIASLCSMAGFKKVQVIRHKTNLGSAGGYKTGIEAAYSLSNDFIMLYDDDVVPLPGSLELLQRSFHKLSTVRNCNSFAIIPYRKSQHEKVVLFEKPFWGEKYNFQGLNIFSFFQRHFFDHGKPFDTSNFKVVMQHGGAAYACLYFHKSLIDVIGLPNPELILYYDDVEYTSRLLQRGGEIWLEVDACCEDICRNYSMDVFSPPFLGYLRADNDAKIFYMMRNRTYLDRFVYKVVSPCYLINVAILLLGISFLGLLTLRGGRVKTIYIAIVAGFKGKLGLHPDFPLS